MSFSEQPPSKQWAALKYRGEKFAEVWFKPEGEPFVVTFRIPHENFRIPGMGKQLTIENLLKAVALVPADVESWRHGDVSHSGMHGSNPDFKSALAPPPPHVAHLDIHVRVNPPPQAVAPSLPPSAGKGEGESLTATLAAAATEQGEGDSSELEISPVNWHDLEARWKTILGLEAAMDALRMSMEGLSTEMENAFRKTLTMEEKTYALRADVAQWERAKTRIQYALPKMRDFIHRSIWTMGSPERKRLEELYKEHIQPHVPFPRMDKVLKQLEELRKDRQVLSAQGKTVYQDSKGISADVQGALKTLQNNVVGRKRAAARAKGRFFR